MTITADRMAGPATMASIDDLPPGTVGLSLREALAIAANHAGPDQVVFDGSVFPATIAIDSELAVAGDATTLDATGAGVTIEPSPGYTGVLVHVTGTNAAVGGLALQGTADEAVRVDTTSNVSITDCHVAVTGAMPIHVIASSDVTIQRAFVALQAKTGTVYGIVLEGSTRAHVLDNIIDPGTAWMIDLQDTSQSEIRGNILDGADTGIVLFGASNNNMVFMNVAIAPAYHAVYVDTAPTGNVVLNNTSLMAASSAFADVSGVTMMLNNLDSTSPADFVSPATYDFHLVAGSPSIDAASDVGQDMLPDSPARFLGAGPDLGAVESY
ncbi:MAG: right-handed parallel beta-helix repeat-containing protein [Acidobacteriota bacterium]